MTFRQMLDEVRHRVLAENHRDGICTRADALKVQMARVAWTLIAVLMGLAYQRWPLLFYGYVAFEISSPLFVLWIYHRVMPVPLDKDKQ